MIVSLNLVAVTNYVNLRFIKKRLLRNALNKRKDEQNKLDEELRKISIEVYGLLSSLDCYIIRALIKKNVNCMVKKFIR